MVLTEEAKDLQGGNWVTKVREIGVSSEVTGENNVCLSTVPTPVTPNKRGDT